MSFSNVPTFHAPCAECGHVHRIHRSPSEDDGKGACAGLVYQTASGKTGQAIFHVCLCDCDGYVEQSRSIDRTPARPDRCHECGCDRKYHRDPKSVGDGVACIGVHIPYVKNPGRRTEYFRVPCDCRGFVESPREVD